jgi:hypothetical protein
VTERLRQNDRRIPSHCPPRLKLKVYNVAAISSRWWPIRDSVVRQAVRFMRRQRRFASRPRCFRYLVSGHPPRPATRRRANGDLAAVESAQLWQVREQPPRLVEWASVRVDDVNIVLKAETFSVPGLDAASGLCDGDDNRWKGIELLHEGLVLVRRRSARLL